MADKIPGDLEAEAYGEIDFVVPVGSSSFKTEKIDCNLTAPKIGGLKKDFERKFDIPKELQRWFFEGKLLSDDKTLSESGIPLMPPEQNPKIEVKGV